MGLILWLLVLIPNIPFIMFYGYHKLRKYLKENEGLTQETAFKYATSKEFLDPFKKSYSKEIAITVALIFWLAMIKIIL